MYSYPTGESLDGLITHSTRSWDNIFSDCLPLLTRAAKPLWGVTSSVRVAAIVYSYS